METQFAETGERVVRVETRRLDDGCLLVRLAVESGPPMTDADVEAIGLGVAREAFAARAEARRRPGLLRRLVTGFRRWRLLIAARKRRALRNEVRELRRRVARCELALRTCASGQARALVGDEAAARFWDAGRWERLRDDLLDQLAARGRELLRLERGAA